MSRLKKTTMIYKQSGHANPAHRAGFILKDGIIHVAFPESFEIDEDVAEEHFNIHKDMVPEGPIYVCVNMDNLFKISKMSRKFFVREEIQSHYGALAMYTSQLTPLVIGNMFLNVDKPDYPGKMFDTREEAEAWIQAVREEQSQQND